MSWPNRDEFLENLVKTNIDKLIKIYEIDDDKYGWDFVLDKLYDQYKLDSLPSWGKNIHYPIISNGGTAEQYEDLIMVTAENVKFSGKKRKKMGYRSYGSKR
jgi:hypothetical protein